jgi:hypothetical protein
MKGKYNTILDRYFNQHKNIGKLFSEMDSVNTHEENVKEYLNNIKL